MSGEACQAGRLANVAASGSQLHHVAQVRACIWYVKIDCSSNSGLKAYVEFDRNVPIIGLFYLFRGKAQHVPSNRCSMSVQSAITGCQNPTPSRLRVDPVLATGEHRSVHAFPVATCNVFESWLRPSVTCATRKD